MGMLLHRHLVEGKKTPLPKKTEEKVVIEKKEVDYGTKRKNSNNKTISK